MRNKAIIAVVAVLTAAGLYGLLTGLAAYTDWVAGEED